jgi:hypothetical protein
VDSTCLSGILNGLYLEYNVDSVILSHYIETKYTNESIDLLKRMVEIIQDLEQMAIREPYMEYFKNNEELTSQTKNQQKTTCDRCGLRPNKIYGKLKNGFQRDISIFYDDFLKISKEIGTNSNEQCTQCVDATQSDFQYLFDKLESLRSYAIYKGFQIVI